MEMARITQMIPNYLKSHFKSSSSEFETQDDLLDVPFVKTYMIKGGDPFVPDPYFYQYSLNGNILIVETFGGKYSHEIGIVNDVSKLTLPKWSET